LNLHVADFKAGLDRSESIQALEQILNVPMGSGTDIQQMKQPNATNDPKDGSRSSGGAVT
jgi:hypothetical protein